MEACKERTLVSIRTLASMRKAALRRGLLFRVLTRFERNALDLTLICVDRIRSAKLADMLVAIMKKLEQAMESIVDRLVRRMGFPLAQKASSIAVGWGYGLASAWAKDRDFARYLAFNISKSLFVR